MSRLVEHTVARHDTKTTDQSNLETTVPNHFSETSIIHIFLFEFIATGATAVFEGAGYISLRGVEAGRNGIIEGVLEVAQFTKVCASSNNREADPEAPNHTT
jgi:hypothetical protein